METTIIIAIISSGALSALVSGIFGLIQARRSKQKEIEEDLRQIREAQRVAEKDVLRTQLLVMLKDYPDEKTDILRLAEYYFKTLGGNWVLTDVFSTWMKANKIEIPQWFRTKGEN